ncbi:ATP-binding cassette domain-containing protein [Enterobacter hormaechei subsp. xiangfangensis]|uniref:AAA family ATPase n=1 Tax=Enterobacter hormaechei TaxID=158836 RepID=UPI000F83E98F|nr:AAA family ATPase [Enterobacter hormaechei]RTM39121.1 ATP-binding cassette domain-containing protein [Enterobacter hormaechei subsp. xiangfangensis]RTM73434.1 ATP-binding cassette domain-containing protein [Enterobacter hormaechei subsp. xiangfangensis]HAV1393122.1 AAA family ATPase [Enterobacter hormaechei subsp. steigerwaltii]HAV1395264.1 AAA family ATPase [Enterobacter hormaechei subsp. steigerwaltii]
MNKNDNYEIIFGSSAYVVNINKSSKYINIYPDKNNFNDFGLDSKVFIDIVDKEINKNISLPGFIGFIEDYKDLNGKYALDAISKNIEKLSLLNEKPYFFFTMLRELKDYRELVENYGVEEANKILFAINDITLTVRDSESQRYKNVALGTDIFNKSFIRNSESYFAYKNSSSVLKGLNYESVGLLSKNITFSSKEVQHPILSFNFDHHSELPKRVSILIGENGVGKSQLLRKIALAAIKGTDEISECDEAENTINRVLINRLLAFSPTNESKSVFPSDKIIKSKIWYRRFSLNRTPSRRNDINTNDIIIELARSNENIRELSRFEIFEKAISNLRNYFELALPLKDSNRQPLYIRDLNDYSEERRLQNFRAVDLSKDPVRYIQGKSHPLSSGEISFIRFCSQICANIENGTLVLLDEPETHLHPAFINKFFAILDTLLSLTGSSAIIATHSVYFIREVFKEQVTILRKGENGILQLEKPRLSTFGANIGNISYFVFGESEPTDVLLRVKRKILKEKMSWSEVYNKYKDDFSINVLTQLRNEIEG